MISTKVGAVIIATHTEGGDASLAEFLGLLFEGRNVPFVGLHLLLQPGVPLQQSSAAGLILAKVVALHQGALFFDPRLCFVCIGIKLK